MPQQPPPWVDGKTFGQVLNRAVEEHGKDEALVFPQEQLRITYSEFAGMVYQAAAGLLAAGVLPGEHVGIWATNLPQWVITQFATALIGAPLVNINPSYRASELNYVLRQADIRTLVLTDRFKESRYFEILGRALEHSNADDPAGPLELKRVIGLQEEVPAGVMSWPELLNGGRQTGPAFGQRIESTRPEQVVNIQYTSGTTGFPKGVQLTHRNLLMNAYHVGVRMAISSEDRVCIPVPFYHCLGCVMGTLMAVVHGATMVIPAEYFQPEATLRAVHQEQCTALYGVPAMFIAQLESPDFDAYDLSTLRTGIMAGSPCPIEVMKQVVEKMGAREITIAYGLTEASPVITQTRTDDSLEHRVSTVGRPLPGVEVKLVEPGTMQPVARGATGELMVRGHGVMKGYYNKPAETASVLLSDGWLHTGDLAAETRDGFFKITGRLKEMLIRGGENLYPREIEEFLYTHPEISDVQVVGLPDRKYGEEVSAWIRCKPGCQLTEEGVRDYCRGKISHQKVPRYVVFVDAYPTTVTGKIQKFKLREEGIRRFGLESVEKIDTA